MNIVKLSSTALLENAKYYLVHIQYKEFKKFLAFEYENGKIWFKDKLITNEQLCEMLENVEIVDKHESEQLAETEDTLKNFFYDEQFYQDLDMLVCSLDIEEIQEDYELDEVVCEVELAKEEPIFELNAKDLFDFLADTQEERLVELDNLQQEQQREKEIIDIINQCFDFKKFAKLLPKYYYSTGKYKEITKRDLKL